MIQVSIFNVMAASIAAAEVGRDILNTAAKAMDAAQAKYNSGEDKLKWVSAFVKSFVIESGHKWEDWERVVLNFIEYAKALFNKVRGK